MTHPLRRSWRSHPGAKIPARLVEKGDKHSRWGSGCDEGTSIAGPGPTQPPQGKGGTKYGAITHRNCIMVMDSVRAMQSLVQIKGRGHRWFAPHTGMNQMIQLGQCRGNGI